MSIFRGNVGNLLQHWVLCEALQACGRLAEQINFVDAYSMAPRADERPKRDGTAFLFDCVREQLPGEKTLYESAWASLAPDAGGYPNSAAFLTEAWTGRYTVLLCESEPTTDLQLRTWAAEVLTRPKCVGVEVARGDWRQRFRRSFSLPGDLAFISFDPNMVDVHGSGRNPWNIHPNDLETLADAIAPIGGALVVQLSTYSANNGNRQDVVLDVVTSRLKREGLRLLAVVRADGNMMSLLLGRNVEEMSKGLGALPARFDAWLARVKARCGRRTEPGRDNGGGAGR